MGLKGRCRWGRGGWGAEGRISFTLSRGGAGGLGGGQRRGVNM